MIQKKNIKEIQNVTLSVLFLSALSKQLYCTCLFGEAKTHLLRRA